MADKRHTPIGTTVIDNNTLHIRISLTTYRCKAFLYIRSHIINRNDN